MFAKFCFKRLVINHFFDIRAKYKEYNIEIFTISPYIKNVKIV